MKQIFFLFALILVACTGNQNNTTVNAKPENQIEFILSELNNPASDYVLVAAHRGDWRNWPENSLEAIEAVIAMGVDIVEIDLAMTSDSILILMHDRTLNRTTNGKGLIAEIPFDSIAGMNLKLQHGVVSHYKIPTLEDALKVCKDRIVINIDKGYDYYDQVMALLEKYDMVDQVLIKGSKKPQTVNAKFGGYTHNMLYMPIIDYRRATAPELFSLYKNENKAQLAYEIVWDTITPEVEQTFRQVVSGGSKLWTNSLWASLCGGLDDDAAMANPDLIYGKHLEYGATIIQTDRPELLINYLQSKGKHN